ncbi:MAG: hypothetical protein H6766_07225 [Candidatus Peribacteria bacterium]|nr:MAG: hypothetical protein H6766_07225 [Candidatus Peribacteria bacterium]
MMHDPRASYHGYMDRWFEDITYAESLLPGAMDLPDTDQIRQTDEALGRIERLYQSW